MSGGSGGQRAEPGLQLIAGGGERPQVARDVTPFRAVSFAQVRAHRTEILLRGLTVSGVTSIEEKAACLKEGIAGLLIRGTGFYTSRIDINFLEQISATHDALVDARAECADDVVETLAYHDERHMRNLSFKFMNDWTWGVLAKEQLTVMLQRQGIRVTHPDLIRLMIYEMNSDYFAPQIIGIWNERRPSNPFYAMLDDDMVFSPAVVRLLRIFAVR